MQSEKKTVVQTVCTLTKTDMSCEWTDPVRQSLGETHSHAIVGLKELVGEVLREEGEQQVGALRVGPERPSLQQPVDQQLRVGQPGLA